jgi:hypothetical protein
MNRFQTLLSDSTLRAGGTHLEGAGPSRHPCDQRLIALNVADE